jgi:two-component system sensor histidine kinase KdpD
VGLTIPFRLGVCLATCAAVVLFFFYVVHVNTTTVSLAMLLLVLGFATKWGLREGVFASIVCVFAFNFFFLPPIGTLTIQDPQNWVALTAFLTCAVVTSQLSAKAKNRTEEALARRSEVERLYQLSRVMLLDEQTDLTGTALSPIKDIFGLRQVVFYDAESGQVHPLELDAPMRSHLERAAQLSHSEEMTDTIYVPVRMGTRVVGSLGLVGNHLTTPEQESIANLVAIGCERTRALKRVAEAEAARQGERLKTFVLDGIAHDLKTPLTAIKTCVTTLITIPPQSDEKRQELLTIIDEETDRLHKTISEAIQLARIEAHKVALQRTKISVFQVIEQSLSGFNDRSRFAVRVSPELTLEADADRQHDG